MWLNLYGQELQQGLSGSFEVKFNDSMLIGPGFLRIEIYEDDCLCNLAFLINAFFGPLVNFLTMLSPEASLKNLLSVKENMESIEGIVNSLILRLVRRMTSLSGRDGGKSF